MKTEHQQPMQTALEWFQELPADWRDAAIRHAVNQNPGVNMLSCPYETHTLSLQCTFEWQATPEGHNAWEDLANALAESLPLPAYPEPTQP